MEQDTAARPTVITDEIKVFYVIGGSTTVTGTSITLTLSTTNTLTYDSKDVDHLEATLDSTSLAVEIVGSGLTMNDIRATAGGSTSEVTSVISWADRAAGPGVDVTFTSPGTSNQYMTWEIGDGVPPVKLKVKIVRR